MGDDILVGWREIARALNLCIKTLRKWHKIFPIPIRRISPKGKVMITRLELVEWTKCCKK